MVFLGHLQEWDFPMEIEEEARDPSLEPSLVILFLVLYGMNKTAGLFQDSEKIHTHTSDKSLGLF